MMPAVIDTITSRGSDIRCPSCRNWRRELAIFEDGALRCQPCPAINRRRSQAGVTHPAGGSLPSGVGAKP